MTCDLTEIQIDGTKFVRADLAFIPAQSSQGLDYRIVRTESAGVFAGYVKERIGQEVMLLEARRLWYWDGAASLSQLAIEGVSKPQNCKFPAPVSEILLLGAVEILSVTKQAQDSIASVPVWKV